MYDYDVIFIGSGHANWHGAAILVGAGKRVAIVEKSVAGGTCTNFGCNAKYLLDTPFDFIDGLENYKGLGVNDLPEISWPELMAYKKQNIGPMGLGLEAMFAQMGITLLKGEGVLADAHTVLVDGKPVTCENIVLGVGEHPNRRDIPGAELLHSSQDFLDMDEFPEHVAFIGAGIISMEFAAIAAKLGKKATIIHHNARVLKNFPAMYVDTLVAKMEREGVTFMLNESVAAAEQVEGGVKLTMESGATLQADYVLDATGRTPNVDGIGLEEVGVAFSRRGIQVDDHMRTSVPNIYASGDCVEKSIPKLTPTAEFESNYIAFQILGAPNPIAYPAIPHLVFTLPRIAQTGVSVEEAQANPDEYRVVTVPYGQMLTFMAKSDKDSSFTFVFDKEGLLAGCAIYGVDAGELINIATMIINLKLTKMQLGSMIFTFPGTTYGLLSALIPQLA